LRKSIKISVPSGLSQNDLQDNLKHAARVLYEKHKPNALMVFAYREGDSTSDVYSAGRCVFAPYGKWEKASEIVSVEKYEAAIDFAPVYFKPQKDEIAQGATVQLQSEKSKKVCLSKWKSSWYEEDMVVCVKNGTKAEVLQSYKMVLQTNEMIRYKVQLKKGRKWLIGWVWDDEAVKITQ